MIIYLIKKDGTYETYKNVIEWDTKYVLYQSGKARCKMYAVENEYFTDEMPKVEETPIELAE